MARDQLKEVHPELHDAKTDLEKKQRQSRLKYLKRNCKAAAWR
jgi:hypothetical protein